MKLSFYSQPTRNAIDDETKTIETRALNPDEPERYFGDVEVGDELTFVNKGDTLAATKEILVRVLKCYQRDNLESLRESDMEIKKKIYSDKQKLANIDNIDSFKKDRDFTPGYLDKIQKNGLVWREFEILHRK